MRQRRHVRALLAATLLTTIVIPAVGSVAGPQDELRETRNRLDALRTEIRRGETREQFLKRRVDALNREITHMQIAINSLDARIRRIESKVRTAQAGIDRTEAEIAVVESRAQEQAVALYKTGSTEAIDALLNSQSLGELNERIEFLGVAAEQNTGALVRYHRLRLEIESQYAELFKTKRELTATLTSKSKYQARMREHQGQLIADLEELRVSLRQKRDREGELEGVALRLTGDIQSAQAYEAVASRGESAQGFIWPLNGGVTSYYGERWGRMHTGIDIDGYTGQAIVASKAGRVIMASYYSGYGNTVILDHGGGYATLYAHQDRLSVHQGQWVEQGKIVGYVGCSGNCYGDHLHFEIRINGNPVDPMKYLP